jgi:hypothetical protein
MNEPSLEKVEDRVRRAAQTFRYPPTPDVAPSVRRRLAAAPDRARRPATVWGRVWALVVVVVLVSGLLAVPQVRAAVLRVLRLGAVQILLDEPAPAAGPTQLSTQGAPPTAGLEPVVTVDPLTSVFELAGQTTLQEAAAGAAFPLRLPTWPADLGPPDLVLRQDFGGPVVVLVWSDPTQPDRARLSLFQLGPGTFVEKVQPQVVRETTVRGLPALWAEGPYLMELKGGRYESGRLVTGNVLIWLEGEITYRLESGLSLDEAVRIAESLQPVNEEDY